MKELVGKIKLKSSNLPRRITVNKVDIFDERKIANEFNAFFTNIGSKLANKIPNASTTFETYINKPDSIMKAKRLSSLIMTSVLMFLKSVSAVYVNLRSICLIYQSKKGFSQMT